MACPPRVQAALESVEGVESVAVDFSTQTATVTAAAGTDKRELIKALEAAEFGGTVK